MIALDNGFEEVVGLVGDADASADRLCAATGFTRIHAGPLDRGALRLLGLAGQAGREVLIGHPGVTRGRIRLIALPGAPAGLNREGAQAWDTGGIFDINIRALGPITDLQRALVGAGFVAHAPITDWEFGPLAVREVVSTDADGLCVALMERVRPPLQGFEAVTGPASFVFNSTQIVPDFEAARAFYRDALGWLPVQETDGMAAQSSGANCLGLPPSLAATIPMRIGIYHPEGRMEGSVEIIALGIGGHDFAASRPPLRGWTALRFPVLDLDDFIARAAGAGCEIVGPLAAGWPPHPPGLAAAAITPWGARLEAFQSGVRDG